MFAPCERRRRIMDFTQFVLKTIGCFIITFFIHFLICEIAEIRDMEMRKDTSTFLIIIISIGCVLIAF